MSPTAPVPSPSQPDGGQSTTREVSINFDEDGGPVGIHCRFEVSFFSGDDEAKAAVPADTMSSQLLMDIPADWRDVQIAVEPLQLPEISTEDEDALRTMYASGDTRGITAMGERDFGQVPGAVSIVFENLTIDPAKPESNSIKVAIPITRTRITANSADALIQTIFPGGRLAQAGIYDARRVEGTNDFELLTAGPISTITQPTSGGGQ